MLRDSFFFKYLVGLITRPSRLFVAFRYSKACHSQLVEGLSERLFGRDFDWLSLTGIRPSRKTVAVTKLSFFIVSLLISGTLNGQNELRQADSLFAIGQYSAARDLYKSQLTANYKKGLQQRPNVLLKMAYIEEVNGDFTQSLYYLSLLSGITPSEAIYEKMEAIALKYRLSGYTFNDFGYFVLYIKKYGKWVYLFLVVVTGYILLELFFRYRKNEGITLLPKAFVLLFLLLLIVVLNIGSFYNEAIVASSPTFLRESPSSASAVLGTIGKGNKVVVLGKRDHWKLVLLDGKLSYIRENDLLLI